MRTGQRRNGAGRGFVLAEAVAVAAVVIVAVAVLAVAGRQNRLASGLAGSMANLKKFGEVTGNYAADYEDQFWTFSWKAGQTPSQYLDLQDASTDLQAAAFQAVDIFRRRFDEDFYRINSWVPHVYTGTVVLADYLDEALPMEWVASPGDAHLLEWQRDPYALGDWTQIRRALRSSYLMPTAFASPDEAPTIYQGGSYGTWFVPANASLGGRILPEVAFPSDKLHLSASASWFFGPRPAWYLEPEARVPVLMVDGSAAVRRTGDANAAWNPTDPRGDDYIVRYNPSSQNEWEPRPLQTSSYSDVSGKYRWTRHGLGGVDFEGERVE